MVMSPLYKKIAVCKFCTSNWLFCPALSDGLYLVSIGFNTHRTLLGTNKMTFPTFSATRVLTLWLTFTNGFSLCYKLEIVNWSQTKRCLGLGEG